VPASETPAGGSLQLDEIAGPGWRAQRIELDWRWGEGRTLALELTAAQLEFDGVGRFHDLRAACPQASLAAGGTTCQEGRARFTTATGAEMSVRLGFRHDPVRGSVELDLQRLDHCAGQVTGRARLDRAGWNLALTVRDLALACLAGAGWSAATLPVAIGSGELDGSVEAGSGAEQLDLSADLALRDLAFDDATGSLAGEALGGRLQGRWRRAAGAWEGTTELHLDRGVLFRDPLLVDAGLAPLRVSLDARTHADGTLEVTRVALDHGPALTLTGRVTLASPTGGVTAADLAFDSRALAGLYATWLQPFLIGTALDDLELTGGARGRIRGAPGAWSGKVELEQVDLADRRGRFALGGLAGAVAWGDGGTPPSRLRWAGGQLLGLALGAADARFSVRDATMTLDAPLRQPLVDGALAIGALQATGLGTDATRMTLSAELEPLSLEALCYAFGWPVMAGQVGGAVPALTYADGTFAVEGDLRVDLFDGTIRIRAPRLERPLGPLASFQADVEVTGLDLELLTRTFTIGRIEGRLGGRIDDLLLHDWRPVRFDAELATPPGDRSRRRISQRAVDSITRVGGLGGALSMGALRFFDDFGYSRLGFRCRLRGAVCELDGVEPAAAGYYLVKGGGLPRIDIIGHVRRVDWAELVERVQQAMAAPGAVVE
jgi:hypothetical protein